VVNDGLIFTAFFGWKSRRRRAKMRRKRGEK
jgi:hypothetical protein